MGFPPIPVYPGAIDDNSTLFQVYNTTETVTVSDTDAFSEEIPILPRSTGQLEIWPDNGYATISGELFYYDAVDTNAGGYVCRLRRCLRNLGGRQSQFNPMGTWVRGFVVAEHHNQLATCILLIEAFVGENFSPNPPTLDWRIRHLADSPIITDDFGCPNIEFDFNIVSTSPATGTLATYNILVQGVETKFNLQFGDGQFTTSVTSGTHQYAPGATIDPIITIQSDTCQTVQSPILRTNPQTPQAQVPPPPFVVTVPIPPPIPTITIPSIIVPPPTLNIPPVVFPCVNVPSVNIPSVIAVTPPINIPSMINITPIHIPSTITIHPPINIPSVIMGPNIQVPSQITFENAPSFPDMIPIGPAPPIAPIQISPPQIPPIQIQPAQILGPELPSVIMLQGPSIIMLSGLHDINLLGLHDISLITTGSGVSLIGPTSLNLLGPKMISLEGPSAIPLVHDLPPHLQLIHNLPESLKVEPIAPVKFDAKSIKKVMRTFGESFAEALKITLPNFKNMKMPSVHVDWGDIPVLKAVVQVQQPKKRKNFNLDDSPAVVEYEHVAFPTRIPLTVPEIPPIEVKHNIPESIGVSMPNIDDIRIDASAVPTEIQLLPPREGIQISVVPFEWPELPKITFDIESLQGFSVPLKLPENLPSFKVDFSDMPTLKVEFPEMMPTIKVEVPENTRIPMFYDGPPISVEPVQINLKIQNIAGEAADNVTCVSIVPCSR